MAPPPSTEWEKRGARGGWKERDDWDGERETGKQVGGRTKNRDVGVSNSCKWWHSVCCNKSSRTKINKKIYLKKKEREEETAPGLLWQSAEHPALSLCQSRSIPRPWQHLLATSSSCVKSAYVLMNVSGPRSCHCRVCFNSPPSAEILPQVYQLIHYILRQYLAANNYPESQHWSENPACPHYSAGFDCAANSATQSSWCCASSTVGLKNTSGMNDQSPSLFWSITVRLAQ